MSMAAAIVAWTCLAAVPSMPAISNVTFARYHGKSIQEWINIARHGTKEERESAVNALANFGGQALPALVNIGREPDLDARGIVAASLERIGPDATPAIPFLIGLLEESDNDIRERATTALASIGPSAIPSLKALLSSPSVVVRCGAAQTIALIAPGSADAVKAVDVIRPLISVANAEVRCEAVHAAWRFGRLGVPLLARAVADDKEISTLAAAKWLSRLGADAADAVPSLSNALKHTNKAIRFWAAASIRTVGPAAEPAIPALLGALDDEDSDVRCLAAQAIGRIGPAAGDAAKRMAHLLGDSSWKDRRVVALALGEIGPNARAATAALERLLVDGRPEVRSAAASALFRITNESAGPAQILRGMLSNDEPQIRLDAATALVHSKQHVDCAVIALKALASCAESDGANVLHGAIDRLGRLGKRAVRVFAEVLDDDSAETDRAAIAEVLGAMGKDAADAVPSLLRIVRRSNSFDRIASMRALGDIGQGASAAIPLLRGLCYNEEIDVRRAAQDALCRIVAQQPR